jgi:hypothetical protein
MKDYTDYVIENKSAKNRAKHLSKKNELIERIKSELGLNPSKSLSIKDLEEYLS